MFEESELVKAHLPCPDCGSSDALAQYSNGTFCFSCSKRTREGTAEGDLPPAQDRKQASGLLPVSLPGEGLRKRHLSASSLSKWGYGLGELNGKPVQVAQYRDLKQGAVIAQKCRTADKEFPWVGDAKAAPLYGQWMWPTGGKRVIVCEGELDAISISQIQNHKWPVVSVKNGAQGARKEMAKHLEWLSSFEEVVLCFDNDEPGRAAAAECAELFEPGKARIASFDLKDASDMLVAGRGDEVIRAIWNARVYRPDGVLSADELIDVLQEEDATISTPYPFAGLNTLTRGLRRGELVTITAGSGVGKSAFVREIALDLLNKGEKVGMIMLEETPRRTLEGLMGLHLNTPIHISREGVAQEDIDAAFAAITGKRSLFLLDHFGSFDVDTFLSRVRYMARGLECKWVVVDHLSILVSGLMMEDERKGIDVAMTKLRTLVAETGIGLILVSHLSRAEGKGHEEGQRVTLKNLRGSHSIAQLSDIVVALERDQQGDTTNTTTVRVLKNRHTGETGVACHLRYSLDTGRLTEVAQQFEADEDDDGDF